MTKIAVAAMISVGKKTKQSVQTANKQCVKHARNTDANAQSKNKKNNKHTAHNINKDKEQYQTEAQTHITTTYWIQNKNG